MNVKDIMNKDTTLITPSTSLQEAAEKMASKGIGFLPIGENDKVQGTVTDRDIVVRGISKGKDAKKTEIREVLSDELLSCREDQDVEEVAEQMSQHQVRRMLVVNDDDRLVGVVSLGDMAQHLSAETAGKVLAGVSGSA